MLNEIEIANRIAKLRDRANAVETRVQAVEKAAGGKGGEKPNG